MPDTPRLPLADVAHAAAELRTDLESMLSASEVVDVQLLAAELPTMRSADGITMAFVGQHDAGKSSLLRCLTGLDTIAVGAGPTTDRLSRFDWHGHILIDTPGVRAGASAQHDTLADEAVGVADVTVFVVTVEGFDETTAAYFRGVVSRLGGMRQLVLVVNKAASERSDRDQVTADMRRVAGTAFDRATVVWTDALLWQQNLDKQARTESGVQDLADVLTDLTFASAGQLRLMTTMRQSREVIAAALRSIAAARGLRTSDGVGLAALEEELAAWKQDHDLTLVQLAGTTSEVRGQLAHRLLEAGPACPPAELERLAAEAIDTVRGVERDVSESDPIEVQALAGSELALLRQQTSVTDFIRRGLADAGRMFEGDGARPGGAGHRLISRIGHAGGHRFKPWEIVTTGRRLEKVAKYGSRGLIVLPIATDGFGQVRGARAAKRQAATERNWAAGITDLVEQIIGPWDSAQRAAIDQAYEIRSHALARARLDVLTQLLADDVESQELHDLDSELAALAASLIDTDNTAGA